MGHAVPFESLVVGTETATETTIPIPIPNTIPPLGVPFDSLAEGTGV